LSSGSSTTLRPNITTVRQPMHAASLFQDGEPIPGWSAPMTTSGLQNERWGVVRANASEEGAEPGRHRGASWQEADMNAGPSATSAEPLLDGRRLRIA
jgi:hypothetical protein